MIEIYSHDTGKALLGNGGMAKDCPSYVIEGSGKLAESIIAQEKFIDAAILIYLYSEKGLPWFEIENLLGFRKV